LATIYYFTFFNSINW